MNMEHWFYYLMLLLYFHCVGYLCWFIVPIRRDSIESPQYLSLEPGLQKGEDFDHELDMVERGLELFDHTSK